MKRIDKVPINHRLDILYILLKRNERLKSARETLETDTSYSKRHIKGGR